MLGTAALVGLLVEVQMTVRHPLPCYLRRKHLRLSLRCVSCAVLQHRSVDWRWGRRMMAPSVPLTGTAPWGEARV